MLALCPDTRTPAKKILAKSTSSANLPPVTVCPIYNRQDPTNKYCSLQIRKMIRWQQTALEGFFDCTFSLVDWDFSLVDWIEARFAVGCLHYMLLIDATREWIQLRSDPVDPDQATPAFEFTFRCDRIRVAPGGYSSEAVYFEFTDGAMDLSDKYLRLVIDRLPSGQFYIWPVIGCEDKAHPSFALDVEPSEQAGSSNGG
jgi:hypothetical protein